MCVRIYVCIWLFVCVYVRAWFQWHVLARVGENRIKSTIILVLAKHDLIIILDLCLGIC